MPALHNARQEAFCLYLVAGNEGKPMAQSAAYRAAGYASSNGNSLWSNASHLTRSHKVIRRMDELKAEIMSAASLSRAAILEQLQRQTLAAEADQSHSAAIHGTELLGKEVCGMFKDRPEATGNALQGRTEESLLLELDEALRALGYAKANTVPLLQLPMSVLDVEL